MLRRVLRVVLAVLDWWADGCRLLRLFRAKAHELSQKSKAHKCGSEPEEEREVRF
jgi:hypothetical protein